MNLIFSNTQVQLEAKNSKPEFEAPRPKIAGAPGRQ